MLKLGFSLCLVYVICTISIEQVPHVREKRRSGEQPSPGRCFVFNRGGISRLHYYSCCNNCDSTDTSCDRKTYHTASKQEYCNTCGEDGTGDGKKIQVVKCGGCRGQQRVYDECTTPITHHIGFCWRFTNCFEDKCKHYYEKNRKRRSVPDSCFNKICDQGEDEQSCPSDCCMMKNPLCDWNLANGTCVPECCGRPSCCNSSQQQTICFCALVLISTFVMYVNEKQFI